MPNATDLLGTVEAAAIIDVERSTLSRWMASGRITSAYRLPTPNGNGAVLFTRAEVERARDEYAAQLAASPTTEAAS